MGISLEDKPSATWFESWDQEIASRMEAREKGDLQVNEGKAVLDKLWKSLEGETLIVEAVAHLRRGPGYWKQLNRR